jgi:hypothetical protein
MNQEYDFVTPYPQEKLDGELGLTATDISKSLEVEAKDIRTKLRERGFLERIEAQGFRTASFVAASKSNGLAFEEIVLDVSASKFFVGKHNSPLGDSYLGFLIRLETRVNTVLLESSTDPILQNLLQAQALRLHQIEQGRKIEQLRIEQDNSSLAPEQTDYLSKLINERLGILEMPPTCRGFLQSAIKERFLPAGAHKNQFTWSDSAKKNFDVIKQFINTWCPSQWQRDRAVVLHNTRLSKKMLKLADSSEVTI